MLTPIELSQYPNEIVKLYEELEAFIISDVSRRIAKTGNKALTPTASYQLEVLQEIGVSMDSVKAKIAETNKLAIEKVNNLLEVANAESFIREQKAFDLAGKILVFSAAKLQVLQNGIKDIDKDLLSFTGSLGMNGLPLERAYHKALNTAYLEVSTGASDYISAIKRQVKALADSGLEIIDYASGHRDKLDVAVRRAVLTGLKDTTNRISEMNAREMGCDGYEISAHIGARLSHQRWQGGQYAIYVATSEYPLYADVVSNEMSDPNCRHSKCGIFLGITQPMLTAAELANIDPPPFVFSVDGKTYDSTKAGEKQRSIERGIRKTKREINGYVAAELNSQEIAARAKLRQQYQLYSQFSREAGLLEQKERLGVVV